MIGARSTCVSVRRVIRICVGMPTARGDRAKRNASCFAPPDDTDGARWLDHLRARATSVDADSMPELGHGLWKPWHWPWSGRRPWTEWPSAFGRRRFFRFRPLLSDLELQQAPRGRMTRGISSAKLATTGFPGSGTRRTLSALDARGTDLAPCTAWFDRELT